MPTIPQNEKDFIKFAKNARKRALEDAAGFNFSPEDVAEIVEAVDECVNACDEHARFKLTARVKRIEKTTAIKKTRKILGRHNIGLRAQRSISDYKLSDFGLPPRDRTLTPVKAPETAPQLKISHLPQWHVIRFWEEGSPRRRRKPEGVIGAEIYVNFDGDGNDLDAYVLKQIAVRSPFIFKYEMADVGKQVHYYLVWLTRRGERSERSRIESATITI